MSEVKTNKISSLASNNDITLDPDGTGNVVVKTAASGGTPQSDAGLVLEGTDASRCDLQILSDDGAFHSIYFGDASDADIGSIAYSHSSNSMRFTANAAERLRVDSSGNVLFSTTSSPDTVIGSSGAGMAYEANGFLGIARAGTPLRLNRRSSDGEIIDFRQDGSTQGYISTPFDTSLGIFGPGSNGAGWVFQSNNRIIPAVNGSRIDDGVDIGNSTFRLDNIFATNTSIQTSDQNEKQDITSLTTAEMTAAKAISKLFKTYKWKSKVAAKGDAARTHTGVIAQEVQTAMSDAGLDAADYAFWCSDTWWETSTEVAAVEADEEAGIEAQDAYTRIDTYNTADEAPEGATQRTRLGIRYAELLAFVGAATEQRLADIETRLTAREA